VLDRDLPVVSWTTGARTWVEVLPAAAVFQAWQILPPVVYPTAVLARSGGGTKEAHALERAIEGRCRAYALTTRERQLVAALMAGDDTRAMTTRLVISRHTVQDHTKSVFAKVGVRSRRQVLARFSGATEATTTRVRPQRPRPREAQ
jgi:DNA-binding CsgD family transcriptional regulator